MAHYKTMFDGSDMLFAHDLAGRDVTVEIEKVYAGELVGEKGRKSKKPFVKIRGRDKKLALNKTNAKTLAALYGNDTTAWIGKRFTMFPTTTEFGGETVDCIRIRPFVPRDKPASTSPLAESPPPLDEQREIAELERQENS